MLTTQICYRVALASIRHNFDRHRNIIIHHGLMGSSKNFRSLSKAPAFSKYANSYLIDARNHGNSPHTLTHTIKDLADDLHEFIITNALHNTKQKLTLMGHSMGGLALMQFTKHYHCLQGTIDRVVIIDIPATPLSKRTSFIAMGTMLQRLVSIDMTQPIKQIHHEIDRKSMTADIAALMKSNVVKINDQEHKWIVNFKVLVQSYKHIGGFDLSCNNPSLWVKPVELIYGQTSGNIDQQQIWAYRQWYPQMQDQNFHMIEGAGHWVHFQKTQAFLESVKKIMLRDEESVTIS